MEDGGRECPQNGSKNKFKFSIPTISNDDEQKSTYKVSSLFKAHQQAKQENPQNNGDKPPESSSNSHQPNQQFKSTAGVARNYPKDKPFIVKERTAVQPSSEKTSNVGKACPAIPKAPSNPAISGVKDQGLSSEQVRRSNSKQGPSAQGQGTSKLPEKSGEADEKLLKVTPGASLNSIIINPRQRGNPIIKHIRNVPWQYGDCVPDYVLGRSTCAIFLSLRYHNLHPDYIHTRMKDVGKNFELRILLVQVDVQDPHHSLKELAKICILADCTLILAWSVEEAGRYLEVYKAYENKPPELLMERTDQNYQARMTECLTTVKSVNKTNVVTLLDSFKSFEKISKAGVDELSICPGFGPQKARRLHEVFNTPFIKSKRKPDEKESESSSSPKKKAS